MKDRKDDFIKVSLNDLILDFKNPRVDFWKQLAENELIKELISEDIIPLIKKISSWYEPTSILITIEENKKYIVIDWNRRVLSCKILLEPNKYKSYFLDQEFEKVKEISDLMESKIDSLNVIVYPDRTAAEKSMAIQHLDWENIKKWKPLRQYRYFKRLLDDWFSIEEISEVFWIDYSRVRDGIELFLIYNLTKDNLELEDNTIFDDKKFKSDKLRRLIQNDDWRRFLWYIFNKEVSKIEIKDEKSFYEKLKTCIIDLYTEDTNHLLYSAQFTKNQAEKYFQQKDKYFLTKKDVKNIKDKEREGQPLFGVDKKKDKTNPIESKKDDSWSDSFRRTVIKDTQDILFWRKLLLKEGKVNSLCVAINDIYEQFKNKPHFESKLLIIWMTLRLVLDVAWRVILKSEKDNIYTDFLNHARKEMENKDKWFAKEQINRLKTTENWIKWTETITWLIWKYAHWNVQVDKLNILNVSFIVWDILDFYFHR